MPDPRTGPGNSSVKNAPTPLKLPDTKKPSGKPRNSIVTSPMGTRV